MGSTGGVLRQRVLKGGRMWSGPQGEHCRTGRWDASGDGVCRGAFCHHLGVWGPSGSVGNTTNSQDGQAGLALCSRDISSSWLQIMPSSQFFPHPCRERCLSASRLQGCFSRLALNQSAALGPSKLVSAVSQCPEHTPLPQSSTVHNGCSRSVFTLCGIHTKPQDGQGK